MAQTPAGHGPEATVESRREFAGRLVKVRVDTVRMDNGREATREVVEHPGAVAVIALTIDRRVLLIRQYRHAVGTTLLELPAGTIEPAEAPADTARRELIEETGYAPSRLTEFVAFHPSPGYSSERITLFLAEDCQPVSHAPASSEVLDVVTLPLSLTRELLRPGPMQVLDGKTLIGLFWLLSGGNVGLFGEG